MTITDNNTLPVFRTSPAPGGAASADAALPVAVPPPTVAAAAADGDEAALRELADWLKARLPVSALRTANGTDAASVFVKRYWSRPDLFVQECIKFPPSRHPYKYQLRALVVAATNPRVSLRGPRGLGKTTWMSWLILWFSITRDVAGTDWKIPTTASVDRQLTKYLWPEVHKWARRLDWTKIPRAPFNKDELMVFSLKLTHGEAFRAVSNDPEKIEGAHAEELMYIFDESKAIISEVFDAVEGAFSVGNVRVVACSTPGTPSGRFYDIQMGSRGYDDWVPLRVTPDEIIAEGNNEFAIWREQRRKQWGERSSVFITQCEGDFASDDADTVIPHHWVQLANERWLALADKYADVRNPDTIDLSKLVEDYPFMGVGVDVGIGNENSARSTLALRFGDVIPEVRSVPHTDTMGTVGKAWALFMKWATWNGVRPTGKIIVDANGVGAGVLHRLEEIRVGHTLQEQVQGFMAQTATDAKDISGELGFINLRSYAWWRLRERLDPAGDPTIALPPDSELIGELVTPKYRITSTGKIQIEAKDEIMKKLGRSTDLADAVVQIMSSDIVVRPRVTVTFV